MHNYLNETGFFLLSLSVNPVHRIHRYLKIRKIQVFFRFSKDSFQVDLMKKRKDILWNTSFGIKFGIIFV